MHWMETKPVFIKNYSIIKSTKTVGTITSAQVYFVLIKLESGEHVFLMMILKKPQCAVIEYVPEHHIKQLFVYASAL
jgi:hypothetical protein